MPLVVTCALSGERFIPCNLTRSSASRSDFYLEEELRCPPTLTDGPGWLCFALDSGHGELFALHPDAGRPDGRKLWVPTVEEDVGLKSVAHESIMATFDVCFPFTPRGIADSRWRSAVAAQFGAGPHEALVWASGDTTATVEEDVWGLRVVTLAEKIDGWEEAVRTTKVKMGNVAVGARLTKSVPPREGDYGSERWGHLLLIGLAGGMLGVCG